MDLSFGYNYRTYSYDKKKDKIAVEKGNELGQFYKLDNHLNDEVEVIEENKEIEKIRTGIDEDNMKYVEFSSRGQTLSGYSRSYSQSDIETADKINELVQAVNKLIKEREE